MLLLLLSRGFDNLFWLDDKGDVSARDNGSGLGKFSWLIQISAERLAELLAYVYVQITIRLACAQYPRRLSCHLMLSVVVRFPSLQDEIKLHLLSR
ncbi:hypothetical protein GQ457_02G033070 [Hibiscus cannabinus]